MDDSGILEAIGRAEASVRRETDRRIREARAWHDNELARYGQLRCALKVESDPAVEKGSTPPTAGRRSGPKGRANRKRLSPASPEELADRRDKIHRLIEENREPVALGAICRNLGLTAHRAKVALQGLIQEGRVKPVGSGSATRYVSSDSHSGPRPMQAPTQGTREERIIAVLEDRHQATAEELAQALREPLARVVETCGKLQGQERISMRNFNGRQVYVLGVRI